MENMKTYTFDEVKDELLGKVGTSERDEHERKVADAVNAFRLGEVVRERRLDQNLTQEELGKRMGVKKSQVSKLERGDDMSLRSMRRVFRALGVESATLDLGAAGKVTLW
ncbi:toxin-antitoxin system antitoxin component Xre family [Alistipes sp. CAG:435]|jgi:ribosome-binding protein aMBF1 (putative translation factor)|nr:helix-turn-helix domain-containing protein [Alistipes sp.]CDD17750.1 toxin-antitoxin system antitoxin component Xre family [Alistipes sp. CAG:435]